MWVDVRVPLRENPSYEGRGGGKRGLGQVRVGWGIEGAEEKTERNRKRQKRRKRKGRQRKGQTKDTERRQGEPENIRAEGAEGREDWQDLSGLGDRIGLRARGGRAGKVEDRVVPSRNLLLPRPLLSPTHP